jgi:hypothetical protein
MPEMAGLTLVWTSGRRCGVPQEATREADGKRTGWQVPLELSLELHIRILTQGSQQRSNTRHETGPILRETDRASSNRREKLTQLIGGVDQKLM